MEHYWYGIFLSTSKIELMTETLYAGTSPTENSVMAKICSTQKQNCRVSPG